MIELWDTSALILAARDPSVGRGLADALAADEVAITEPIILEYLNGARNVDEYLRFDVALRAARVLETTPTAWQRALEVHAVLATTGAGHQRSVRLVDLIVAAVAEGHGLAVVHCDADYERIARLTSQPTRRVGPGSPAGRELGNIAGRRRGGRRPRSSRRMTPSRQLSPPTMARMSAP